MKCKVVELNKNEYAVKKSDGTYINTIHAQFGIIPYTWNKKFNSIESIEKIVKETWGYTFESESEMEIIENDILEIEDDTVIFDIDMLEDILLNDEF